MKMRKKKSSLHATRLIVLSFILLILVGSILLSLPIMNKTKPQPYINNLFVATSCVCVTGLTPFTIIDQYNLAGQIVMMVLIQLGGLGFVTFLYLILYAVRRKVSVNTKLIFKEALNQDDFSQLPRLLKTIFYYTGIVELIGAVLLAIQFVPKYGFATGIYYGLWHSISAFCNAGFDLLGSNSLMNYTTSIPMNLIIMALIISGGIGFLVVLDIRDTIHKQKHHDIRRIIYHLSLHSKIVLLMTVVLIVLGTVGILLMEFNNRGTLGNYPFGDKVLLSLFQSVTLRTAGFATLPQVAFRDVTKLFMCVFMFIGGSPASTAGGIKTVTFALVVLTMINVFYGKEETYIFHRRIRKRLFLRAFTLFSVGITLCLTGVMVMLMSEEGLPSMDVFMEVFSAFGTVGLSADVTGQLSHAGKIVDIILMFIGRISPMSLSILFAGAGHHASKITYSDEDVIIG